MQKEIQSLAEEAGREIMRIYRSGDWTVSAKSDDSPVTQADLEANAILTAGLSQLVDGPIISEESETLDRPIGAEFWLIDPLDGTRDFVARLDTFVICIARIKNGFPDFGLIHRPLTRETWWAAEGQGAHGPLLSVNDDINLKSLYNQETRSELIAAGSRSMPSERMQVFYDRFSIRQVLRVGSALKFCMLAAGEVDLYPRFGPTNEWDTAAGQIIVEQAGCKVLDISTGQRLRYGKPGFANSHGFMASRADLDLIASLKKSGLVPR